MKSCWVFLFYSLVKSLSETYHDDSGSLSSYCNQIFAGWDYCITHENAAKDKAQNLLQNVRVCPK